MTFSGIIGRLMRSGVVSVTVLLGLSMPAAQAGVTVTLQEQGADVVMSASGTLNLSALTQGSAGSCDGGIRPTNPVVVSVSPGFGNPCQSYIGTFAGPAAFGPGLDLTNTSAGPGEFTVTISPDTNTLVVPPGYVSGAPVSGTVVFENHDFSSLGVTPGTYTWTWGTGEDADFFTLNITDAVAPVAAQPVPVLPGWGLMLLVLLIPALAARSASRRVRN